ncbi:MAG: SEC-C domain-containing protein [Candidatus Hydrogenedentes bacterium]|nr:SEC-C domain-containing protein [Candidatus Hydrogenedentota bacterium]
MLLALHYGDVNNRAAQRKAAEQCIAADPYAIEAHFMLLPAMVEKRPLDVFRMARRLMDHRAEWNTYFDQDMAEPMEEFLNQILREAGNIPHLQPGAPQPLTATLAGPGPNEPCSCGSGKKYKKCCGRVV